MASATVEQVQTKFQMIELGKISESPMNPRKHFDPQSLKELAESIKSHGVQQPIVVRPDGNKHDRFEIVVGARRSRAAKLAGVKEIPAVIRELSNAAALEIMVIENLQREDVHPLDEALGYEALMKKASETDAELGELPGAPRHTAESIAAKVGKSVGYVYARLKLLALVPAAREAFEGDRITPGHAVLIARLTPIDQIKGLASCFSVYPDDRELRKEDPSKLRFSDVVNEQYEQLRGLIPEKGLREWIQENINLKLKDVPWDLDDAQLLPIAGACTTCLKRSVSNPNLFAELAIKGEDTCFDAQCFNAKRSEFVKIQLHTDKVKARIAEKEGTEAAEKLLQLSDMNAYTKPKPDQAVYRAGQWISAKPGSCADVKPGILVRGENAGQRKNVCINPSCKTHKHQLHSAEARSGSGETSSYEEQSFQNHRQEIALQKKARARGILIQEIVKGIGGKLSVELLRYIAEEMDRGDEELIGWLMGEKKPLNHLQLNAAIHKADGAKLNKLVAALALSNFLGGYGSKDKEDREHLTVFAKSFGLKNAATVLASADKEIAAAKSCRACGCTEEIPCSWYDVGRKHCSWKEPDLCTNPKCIDHEKRVAAKKAKGGK